MTDALDILAANPVFAALDPAAQQGLAALAVREIYDSRSLLVGQGDVPSYLRYIVRGRVDLIARDAEGNTAAIPLAAGGWATWLGCFVPAPIAHEMWCATGSEFLALPTQAVRKTVQGNAVALMAALQVTGRATRLLIGWIHVSMLNDAERRMAYLLLANCPTNSTSGTLTVSREELGEMGFGSRQFVSRVLAKLEAQGIVRCGYKHVEITDIAILAQFAQGGSAKPG